MVQNLKKYLKPNYKIVVDLNLKNCKKSLGLRACDGFIKEKLLQESFFNRRSFETFVTM